MARNALKATGNVWYDARMEASKYNEKLSSREGVEAETKISVDSLRRIENDLNKVMPVDNAVLLADLYNSPELLNYYCLHECPIGRRRPLSDDKIEIDRATVKLTQILRKSNVQRLKYGLQDIAADGEIGDDEFDDFDEIMEELREISKIISELEIIRDRKKSAKLIG